MKKILYIAKQVFPLTVIFVVITAFMVLLMVLLIQGTIALGYTFGTWIWPFSILGLLLMIIFSIAMISSIWDWWDKKHKPKSANSYDSVAD